ncbi:MAG: helix-turn-helix domain-containing protein [Bifidobacteriaceae bacterium]|jgi:transcriptional regulator with XRE-family HTH domain|nr:helix-turn-helix domain-containing protein [Bifidobacteriaceae bacterium]
MNAASALAWAMRESGTSQTELSGLTGVSQGRISEYVAGKVTMSQAMLSHLLSAMGYAAEIAVIRAPLNISDERSWRLHRAVAKKLTAGVIGKAKPRLIKNVLAQRAAVRGEPHLSHLAQWERMIRAEDVQSIRRCCLDVGDFGREMREVSPLGGILTQSERLEALAAEALVAVR